LACCGGASRSRNQSPVYSTDERQSPARLRRKSVANEPRARCSIPGGPNQDRLLLAISRDDRPGAAGSPRPVVPIPMRPRPASRSIATAFACGLVTRHRFLPKRDTGLLSQLADSRATRVRSQRRWPLLDAHWRRGFCRIRSGGPPGPPIAHEALEKRHWPSCSDRETGPPGRSADERAAYPSAQTSGPPRRGAENAWLENRPFFGGAAGFSRQEHNLAEGIRYGFKIIGKAWVRPFSTMPPIQMDNNSVRASANCRLYPPSNRRKIAFYIRRATTHVPRSTGPFQYCLRLEILNGQSCQSTSILLKPYPF